MHILILSWRDIGNPNSGGAERATYELAVCWAKKGHKVRWLSSAFVGAKRSEVVEQIAITRYGRWWNIHLIAPFYYFFALRNWAHVVIDQVHFFPFFSIFYAGRKTVLFACEVATPLFPYVIPRLFVPLARRIEQFYFRLYQSVPTLAISESTKQDLMRVGFHQHTITVLPLGVSPSLNNRRFTKEQQQTILYVGRLNRQKGADVALDVIQLVHKKLPQCQLWFIGTGSDTYQRKLEARVKRYDLKNITFFGYVSEEEKFKLMAKAHVLIVPSIHEGWGLVVSEAATVGTPAVVYNVSGLRDVVKQERTGLITQTNPESMADAVISLLKDVKRLKSYSQQAIKSSRQFSWDKTAEKALSILKQSV